MIKVLEDIAVVLAVLVLSAWTAVAYRLMRVVRRDRRQSQELERRGEQPEPEPDVDEDALQHVKSLLVCHGLTDPAIGVSDRRWREFLKAHGLRVGGDA